MSRQLDLGELLTAATGYMLTGKGVDGLYDVMSYLVGRDLYTHELPLAFGWTKPYLLEKFPWVKEIDTTQITQETWETWIQEQIKKYGNSFEVEPLKECGLSDQNPIKTLEQVMGGSRAVH